MHRVPTQAPRKRTVSYTHIFSPRRNRAHERGLTAEVTPFVSFAYKRTDKNPRLSTMPIFLETGNHTLKLGGVDNTRSRVHRGHTASSPTDDGEHPRQREELLPEVRRFATTEAARFVVDRARTRARRALFERRLRRVPCAPRWR